MMIYQAKFTRDGGQGSFGWGLSLSAHGDYALIGGGPAAVFSRRYGWSQQAMLTGGSTVALTSNGDTAFIGNGDGVYLYRRIAGNWFGVDTLMGSGATDQSFFGQSVAVGHNLTHTTALIGGPGHDNYKGAVWVFVREPVHNWIEQVKLTPSVGPGYFGWSVALSADGNTVLIGGIYADNNRGAVWTYMRDDESRWHPFNRMGSPDRSDMGFGYNVALSHDGRTALITDSSGVRAFTRTLSGWQQEGEKLPVVGSRAALSADGNIALIGEHTADRAWLWLRAGALYELTAPDKIGFALFGYNVALTPDGNTALIGGSSDDGLKGAAWLFITPLGVSGVSPSSGPTTGGTTVTISGNGFNGARRVQFGTTAAASFTVDGATQITAVSPPRQPGTVNVTVTTSVGNSEAIPASQFTYV